MFERCIQINLQQGFGGGEVYAAAFARAVAAVGLESVLVTHPRARAWGTLDMEGVKLAPLTDVADLPQLLGEAPPCWLVFHTFAPAAVLEALKARGHLVTAFAHMPLYGRNPEPLRPFDAIFGVSLHVIASCRAVGLAQVYDEPMYGIAHLERTGDGGAIRRNSRYDWDRRKLRDRALGWIEALAAPLLARVRPPMSYARRPGLTLGIVSRLTPIKQFPLLFRHLAPVLARHPEVNLEIFGSGGYASVRDLRRELAPLGGWARWWGHQKDVGAVFRQIDYLLTGLPEKEAMGLNVIEAQVCGTPVLAVRALPFTETVAEGVTGLFYDDPRTDAGASFDTLLHRLATAPLRIDRERAAAHLERFSLASFQQRVARLAQAAAGPPQGGMEPPRGAAKRGGRSPAAAGPPQGGMEPPPGGSEARGSFPPAAALKH
ncbi:MAG: glycosyltransferase family 4 protein [Betaproteobacteria bacterium]|nr:glycosyltransferase family 4 protein [Betaproteobacteria bacterium]